MIQLKELEQRLKYASVPEIYSQKLESIWMDESYSIYLDISDSGKITSYGYKTTETSSKDRWQWLPFFELLGDLLVGSTVSEVSDLSWDNFSESIQDFNLDLSKPFVNLPVAMFDKLLKENLGISKSTDTLKNCSSKNLICRCFSVYSDEIYSIVQENSNADVMTMTNSLEAGGGCTSCADDIETAIVEARDLYAIVPQNQTESDFPYAPMGLTPAEFALEIDTYLQTWAKSKEVELEIEDVRDYKMKLRLVNQDHEFKSKEIKDLSKNLGIDILRDLRIKLTIEI
jgi:bacterioferritin-associated ferredoxin